jgi:hypothetical protein
MLSGVVMFLFFGLIVALPQIHYNRDLFPGTWHMYVWHMEAIQNGLMLMIVALVIPFLELSIMPLTAMEVLIHIGAWFNVFPWIYGARTGAIFVMHEFARSQPPEGVPKPENNEELVGAIVVMLTICALSDILGFGLLLYGLVNKMMMGSSKEKKA